MLSIFIIHNILIGITLSLIFYPILRIMAMPFNKIFTNKIINKYFACNKYSYSEIAADAHNRLKNSSTFITTVSAAVSTAVNMTVMLAFDKYDNVYIILYLSLFIDIVSFIILTIIRKKILYICSIK